jgi:hypothetical protein
MEKDEDLVAPGSESSSEEEEEEKESDASAEPADVTE